MTRLAVSRCRCRCRRCCSRCRVVSPSCLVRKGGRRGDEDRSQSCRLSGLCVAPAALFCWLVQVRLARQQMSKKGQDATAAQTQRRVVPKERGGGKRKRKKKGPGEDGCKSEGEKRKRVEREKKKERITDVLCGGLWVIGDFPGLGSNGIELD